MKLIREMKIEQRYLNFAVNNHAEPVLIRLTVGGTIMKEFEIRLGNGEVSFWTYIDLEGYEDKVLKIEGDTNIHTAGYVIQSEFPGGGEELYHEKSRPQYHFTPKLGQICTLLDLKYKEGTWQLLYRHNPFGGTDRNSFTGYAFSRDLIHWHEAEGIYDLNSFQGLDDKEREETNFYELPVNENFDERKWICFSDKGIYKVGHFTDGKFIPDQPEETLWFGLCSSRVVHNQSGDNRCILIGLIKDSGKAEMPLKQPLMIPVELKLKSASNGMRIHASPVRELQNLRVWKREWSDIHLCSHNEFSSNLSFKIVPGNWPDICILPAEGTQNNILSDMLEAIFDLDIGEAGLIEIKLYGISIFLNFKDKTVICQEVAAPLYCDSSNMRIHMLLDKSSLEIFLCDGLTALSVAVLPDITIRDVQLFCHEGKGIINSMEIFGLRGIWPTEAESKLFGESMKENSVIYKSESYTISSSSIEDVVYGEPPAYVPDRNTIVSTVRVTEEFSWRKSHAGDMVRVIDRQNIWHPKYEIKKFPDVITGYNTFDAAYRLALDIFYRCTSDEFARPGEKGLWSAGQFQGPGEGFGVWVRDTAHVAIRVGNLLDPEGARRSLLYTTMDGFDNGVDGIGLPIVGIWDYYLATGDLTLIRNTWTNLKARALRLEERFDSSKGLIMAEQSTSNDAFPEPECGGFSLATEIYFMEAFRAMAKMGKYMEEEKSRIDEWNKMGNLLLENIRKQYWNESAGFFTSGPAGSESYNNEYWESSGQEMAMWPRYGIANKEQRSKILDKLPIVAMNEFGVNVFPYREEVNHF